MSRSTDEPMSRSQMSQLMHALLNELYMNQLSCMVYCMRDLLDDSQTIPSNALGWTIPERSCTTAGWFPNDPAQRSRLNDRILPAFIQLETSGQACLDCDVALG